MFGNFQTSYKGNMLSDVYMREREKKSEKERKRERKE